MFSNLKRKTRVHRIVWRFHPRSLNPTEIQITYRFASPKKNPVLSHLSENPGVYRPPFPATPETHGAPLPVSFPSQPRIASLLFKSSATVRRPCVRLSAPTANDRRRRRRQRSLTAHAEATVTLTLSAFQKTSSTSEETLPDLDRAPSGQQINERL